VGIENPIHLLFIALVALLVLGPKRLPELARALGHGIREFRETISGEPAQPRAGLAPPHVAGAAVPPAAQPPAVAASGAPAVATDAATPPVASTAAAAPAPPVRRALTETAGVDALPATPAASAPAVALAPAAAAAADVAAAAVAAPAPAPAEAAPGVDPA
jgi:TatA/E family protein of Tat protein translocase